MPPENTPAEAMGHSRTTPPCSPRPRRDLVHPGVSIIQFLYPPVYLLLCAPLALLAPLAAFLIFEAITLVLYLGVLRKILDLDGWHWLLRALAFAPTFWTIGYGQNGFLTAALLGAGTLLIDRRPVTAGILFGALCYKPHFALLVPAALIAGSRRKCIAGAAIAVVLLVALSIVGFGWDTWQAYLRNVVASSSAADFQIEHINIFASISPFAAARLFGLGDGSARLVQLVATVASVILVVWTWRDDSDPAVRSAALAAATLVGVPYGLLYDLTVAAIAGAWLIRRGMTRGFIGWEQPALVAVYLLPLFSFQVGLMLHVPLAQLVGLTLMLLYALHALRDRASTRPVTVARTTTAPSD